jgi:hypothetical protein
MSLSSSQIDAFVADGFVRIDDAFPRPLADEARAILWRDTGCDPDEPKSWTKPVIRLGDYAGSLFREAANTTVLTEAYDALVGVGRWLPRGSLGTFPVRFPSTEPPGDDGWHVDASFPGEDAQSFFDWRVNYLSRGRALLMLFLFSDVDETDAPTRIRVGSHRDVAKLLEPVGEAGMSFMELGAALAGLPARTEALASGPAGTVYVCHPLLAHTAQRHHGTRPRFMAQPPLLSKDEFRIDGPSPVERAIREAVS